jgi:hypothetical protein
MNGITPTRDPVVAVGRLRIAGGMWLYGSKDGEQRGRGLPASSRSSARASPSPSCPPGVSSHPSGRTPLIRLHARSQREWGSAWAHAGQGIDRTRRGPARSMGEQWLGSRVS